MNMLVAAIYAVVLLSSQVYCQDNVADTSSTSSSTVSTTTQGSESTTPTIATTTTVLTPSQSGTGTGSSSHSINFNTAAASARTGAKLVATAQFSGNTLSGELMLTVNLDHAESGISFAGDLTLHGFDQANVTVWMSQQSYRENWGARGCGLLWLTSPVMALHYVSNGDDHDEMYPMLATGTGFGKSLFVWISDPNDASHNTSVCANLQFAQTGDFTNKFDMKFPCLSNGEDWKSALELAQQASGLSHVHFMYVPQADGEVLKSEDNGCCHVTMAVLSDLSDSDLKSLYEAVSGNSGALGAVGPSDTCKTDLASSYLGDRIKAMMMASSAGSSCDDQTDYFETWKQDYIKWKRYAQSVIEQYPEGRLASASSGGSKQNWMNDWMQANRVVNAWNSATAGNGKQQQGAGGQQQQQKMEMPYAKSAVDKLMTHIGLSKVLDTDSKQGEAIKFFKQAIERIASGVEFRVVSNSLVEAVVGHNELVREDALRRQVLKHAWCKVAQAPNPREIMEEYKAWAMGDGARMDGDATIEYIMRYQTKLVLEKHHYGSLLEGIFADPAHLAQATRKLWYQALGFSESVPFFTGFSAELIIPHLHAIGEAAKKDLDSILMHDNSSMMSNETRQVLQAWNALYNNNTINETVDNLAAILRIEHPAPTPTQAMQRWVQTIIDQDRNGTFTRDLMYGLQEDSNAKSTGLDLRLMFFIAHSAIDLSDCNLDGLLRYLPEEKQMASGGCSGDANNWVIGGMGMNNQGGGMMDMMQKMMQMSSMFQQGKYDQMVSMMMKMMQDNGGMSNMMSMMRQMMTGGSGQNQNSMMSMIQQMMKSMMSGGSNTNQNSMMSMMQKMMQQMMSGSSSGGQSNMMSMIQQMMQQMMSGSSSGGQSNMMSMMQQMMQNMMKGSN